MSQGPPPGGPPQGHPGPPGPPPPMMHMHPMQMQQMQQMHPMMMQQMMMEQSVQAPPAPKDDEPTPICRCRVLYLGSAVPHVTKDGLQGIQEPLKELYPEDGALGAKGIDSWLSVWSNGFLLENMDENRKKVSRFFPIESLHYCAAVRYVLVPGSANGTNGTSSNNNTLNRSASGAAADKSAQPRFLPLDSPFARNPNINHPPLFAAILRRTTGIKVLECHVFICKRETAANALVRCSFHSYADSTYAKHLETGGGTQSIYGTLGGPTPIPSVTPTPGGGGGGPGNGMAEATMTMRAETPREYQQSVIEVSEDSINSIEKVEEWKVLANGNRMPNGASPRENGTGSEEVSVFNGDENHKVWAGKTPEPPAEGLYDYGSTLRSFRSTVSGTSHRNRPRQMLMPSSPPPPPIPEERPEDAISHAQHKKDKKKKKRSKSRDALDSSAPPGMMQYMGNGSILNGGAPPPPRKHSSSGSLMGVPRSMMNGHGPPPGHPGHGPPPGHPSHGPPPGHPGNGVPPPMKSGTFTGRGKKGKRGGPPPPPQGPYPPFMMYGMPPPPHLMPPPGHPLYGGMPPYAQPMFAGAPPPPMNGGRPGSRAMEEPIYMPHNARPLSPVASYQPGHFPHEAYYNQQQYATIDKAGKHGHRSKGKSKSKQNGNGSGTSNGHGGGEKSSATPLMMSSDSNAEDSEFGAGIYKKGHINERAFSYSIRNEHRSRSFGSLAEYGPDGEPLPPQHVNGGGRDGGSGPEDEDPEMEDPNDPNKKEFLHNMMSELELGDDTIERREVPPGFYPPPTHANGPRPHMMMVTPNGDGISRKKR